MSKDKTKQKPTILIVEDEPAILSVLHDTLQKNNFSTLLARNGREGLEQALSAHPDLIMLDLLMPVMDGMACLKQIRQDSWGKQVPVIILTNLSADAEDRVEDMVEQNPAFYLIKSDWKMEDVVKKIKTILD